MEKIVLVVLAFLVLIAFPKNIQAYEVAAKSASLMPEVRSQESKDSLLVRTVIKEVLEEHNSPLLGQVDAFMATCIRYDLDCYLLPSITGVESTFGRFLMPGSYNPFGWGGGYIYFESWADGIDTVGSGLRNNYINRGATSIEAIGAIYAGSTTWSAKVNYFIDRFEQKQAEKELYFHKDAVQL